MDLQTTQQPAHRSRGKNIPLSPGRRVVCDLLHFARQMPSIPVLRRVRLAKVQEARNRCPRRPSWVALFCRAYGRVAARTPPLRRAYFSVPYPYLYEHPESIATVAVSRQVKGEEMLLFAPLKAPERVSVAELDSRLQHYKSGPVEELAGYRHSMRFSRLPTPIRRLVWWIGLNFSGKQRARHFGTFGVSVYSSLGAQSLHPLSPLTTLLNYGPIAANGDAEVCLVYDHRVLDGSQVARALADLEAEMNGPVAAEVLELGEGQRHAA